MVRSCREDRIKFVGLVDTCTAYDFINQGYTEKEKMTREETITEQLRVLDDTVKFYSENPKERRAVTALKCCYETEDGRHCAVGRFLSDLDLQMLREKKMLNAPVESLKDTQIVAPLNLTWFFWSALQQVHDKHSNWDSDKLNKCGEEYVQKFREQIEAGSFA